MSKDLALNHQPLTDLFCQPSSPEQWSQFQLTEEQIKHFNDQGYVSGIKLLNDEQVKTLREELAEMVDPNHEGHELFYEYHSNESGDPESVLFHALGAWRVRKAFHDLLWNPAFLVPAYQLLGKKIRLFHDQLFSKPAKHGGVVAWHQDFSYWTWTKPMNHLTCWIGLDDADEENGCLHYVPGSHRWGLLKKTGLAGDMDSVREVLTPEQIADFDKKCPIILKKGEAVFHHPLMMHGSYENRSYRSRRATVINTLTDGVLSNFEGEDSPGTTNFPMLPKGQKMEGDFYPILFDPEHSLNGRTHLLRTINDI